MSKRPTGPFRNASDSATPREETIRDKDNASLSPKPSFAQKPAPNLAPPGMKGIQRTAQPGGGARQPQSQDRLISIVKTHPKPELLTGGRFTDKPGYGFAVAVNPFRTVAGIDGGKITQLEIQQEGKIIAQYKDRHWTRIPESEEQKQLVQRLQDQFGERRRDFVPIVPTSPDKDRGHER